MRQGKRVAAVLIGALVLWCSTAAASATGSIRGTVVHQGEGVAHQRVMLIRFGPDQRVERFPGETDAEGRFRFDNLETGEAFTYVVGVRYGDALYQSDPIVLQAGEVRSDVVLRVGEAAAAPPLRIARQVVLVALQDERFVVREIVELRHRGTTPYTGEAVASGHATFSLHLPLPPGYTDVRLLEGLESEHLHALPAGLYYTAPLPPGDRRIVYTYELPRRGRVTTVLFERALPTEVLDVLVDATHLAANSDLGFVGRLALEPHQFLHFRGLDLEARSRSWLQLAVVHGASRWLRLGAYALVGALVLGGLAAPLYGARRRQGRAAPLLPQEVSRLEAEYGRLLRALARLDDRHAAGELAAPVYQERRQQLKRRLLAVAAALQQSGQPFPPATAVPRRPA
ncbi:MAG: hypothetical protein KatS3mg131_2170 [Candidatus Tectimicrobiota bacterium]|nr:MAG: hypothetical protein KatS3mg131_2170 [Candidatus Tectomicrobia bacterium]